MHASQNADLQACIQTCRECLSECQETLYEHCLEMGGEHAKKDHVKLMTDCIQICQTAADFMSRGSELHAAICAACAEVCESCAESCERIGGERMLRCAEICRQCAQSCREMGKMKKAA